jgi:hypothetical protein
VHPESTVIRARLMKRGLFMVKRTPLLVVRLPLRAGKK